MYGARYRRILWFFARITLAAIWWDILLLRLGFRRWVRRTRPERLRRAAQSFRLLAVEMGGVMIKVGQFLSARLDILPRQVTDTLAGLQDEVRPETFADIRQVVEAELNAPLAEFFSEFEETPVASASIGQVHRARLRQAATDEAALASAAFPAVVVKVQRPNIERIVEIDLAALRVVSGWLMRYPPIRRHANVPALLEEFSRSLHEEMDYLHEGKNAEIFARNFQHRPVVRVPRVYWPTTTRRVLVLEDIQAIKITDYAAITAAGVERAAVAECLLDTYLKQIFEDRFFHADPHPGNLFVLPLPAEGETEKRPWQLVFVDFGMTGQLTEKTLKGMREMLIAVATRDAARVVRAYQILEVLLPDADLELLERANVRAFEKLWGKTFADLRKMRHAEALEFVREFEDLIYEMPFQLPENMILLGRCLSILNGICTGLNPDFNAWAGVVPYANRLLEAEQGIEGRWQYAINELGEMLRSLVTLPQKAEHMLNRLEQGRLEVRLPELKQQIARLEQGQRRLIGAILFAALTISATQAYLAGHTSLAAGLGLGALLALGWILVRRGL